MTQDPTRWLDDEHEDPSLRALLRAGREELPTAEALARLEARVLGPLGPGGGGPGEAPPSAPRAPGPAAPVAASAKAALFVAGVAGVAVLSALSVALLWPAPPSSAPAPTAPPAPTPVAADPPAPPAELPRGVDAPAAERESPRARRADPAAPEAPAEGDELSLLSAAQRALASDPARALRLADEHATRFAEGTLAQEREVLAIDALLRTGRQAAAQARAARFRARWPSSAHLRRIDVLLAGTER